MKPLEQNEFEVRQNKLNELREHHENPYKYNYERTAGIREILDTYNHLTAEDTVDTEYRIAGRLISRRGHGKASFANVLDQSGSIQIYSRQDNLGEEAYEQFLKLDIGDIIGVAGIPFRTHKGELSLKVTEVVLLTKSLHPLPEKYHGLTDKEVRYRKRYIDLIANPEVRDAFFTRSDVTSHIRRFLQQRNFMEVETPVLNVIPGGATARPFITYHNTLDMQLYLRIAPELYLKRLIVGGFERVFEIGRVFRNEGISYKHNPEYTLLELYQAYADYQDIMNLTEELIVSLVKAVKGSTTICYQGQEINFTPPFKRLTMTEAIREYTGIDIMMPLEQLRTTAQAAGIEGAAELTRGQILNKLYDEKVEEHLKQPTFIMDYPVETSPLAKKKRDNDALAERFELIVNGMELANAFSELNDPADQRARFEAQVQEREAGDEEAQMMDTDYIEALQYGMPPTGGLGIGIDRLVMLLTDAASIRDVILFPHMRSKS